MCRLLKSGPYVYSRPLQERIIDFGAESSFQTASRRLEHHHSICLSAATVRKLTLQHAANIYDKQQVFGLNGRVKNKGPSAIITQMDGSMLPVVSCSGQTDRRKSRDCHWREARLSVAQAKGQQRSYSSVTMEGVEVAGHQWAETVHQAGWASHTQLHVVGDGAPWIAQQARACLDSGYLVDFYHVCEYLAAAEPAAGTHSRWLQVQKDRLKSNRVDRVLKALEPFKESEDVGEPEAPVRAAIRYQKNRLDQLDYASAVENELPIGSGMVESAHRHILQARIKIAGAWWTEQNAAYMAALRVHRHNHAGGSFFENAA